MNDKNELETYIQTMIEVYRILDNVKYECSSREYTLDEDAMGWIFYCRDTIWLALQKFGKENG